VPGRLPGEQPRRIMNKEPIVVRGSASVWLAEWQTKNSSAGAMLRDIATGKLHVSEPLLFPPNYKPFTSEYIKIGTAEIVLSLVAPDEVVADEIRALQASLEAMRVEHHRAQQALLNRISKLQAITFDPEA
jgi:hypothetical protein